MPAPLHNAASVHQTLVQQYSVSLSAGDALHIGNFNRNDVFNSSSIDSFEFADGTTLTTAQLLARGFDLDDKILGAANDANYKDSLGRMAA